MPFSGTVVLNCAGIGSRLGMCKTKVLLEIDGKSLLERHLENFSQIRDLRIVIGYQSADVIAATLALRRDVVFVYNHDYFDTTTAYSLWLGARFGSELITQWDGDLLIHPDDALACLKREGEFAAYSARSSQDGVYCEVDSANNITSFSRSPLAYEWTGPCCLSRDKITDSYEYIYNIMEKYLPMPGQFVRAMDIDTPEDFITAKNLLNEWKNKGA